MDNDTKEAEREAIRKEIWRVYGTDTPEQLAERLANARDQIDVNRLLKSHRNLEMDLAAVYRLLNIPEAQLEKDVRDGWPGVADGISHHLGKRPIDPVAEQQRGELRALALSVKQYEDHLRERVDAKLKGAPPEERKHFEARIEALVAEYRTGLVRQQSHKQAMPGQEAPARSRQQQRAQEIER